MDQPSIPATSTTDQFCFTGNYCPLGVMFTPTKYTYGTASVACQMNQVLDIQNKTYNLKDFQRLYNFRASINYDSPNFFIIDLCSLPCRFFTVCSLNDYYYDIVFFFNISPEQDQLEVSIVLLLIVLKVLIQIKLLKYSTEIISLLHLRNTSLCLKIVPEPRNLPLIQMSWTDT
jgi:hypothetical protein